MVAQETDVRIEAIAREVKRLREDYDKSMANFRDWILRLNEEMDKVYHELAVRRSSRR